MTFSNGSLGEVDKQSGNHVSSHFPARGNERAMNGIVLARTYYSGMNCPRTQQIEQMLGTDGSDQVQEGEFVDLDEPARSEPVPVSQPVHWMRKAATPRPDPTFLAQLIATADQAPQTRMIRRASPADAQTAYGAAQIRNAGASFRTQQTS
jgi:hypothetical protein